LERALKNYLIDTNIVIYYYNETTEPEVSQFIEDIIETSFNISVVTHIEFINYGFSPKHYKKAIKFLEKANIIHITDEIQSKAEELEIKYRLKRNDAFIAATSLIEKMTLLTRNIKDFSRIIDLNVENPFENDN